MIDDLNNIGKSFRDSIPVLKEAMRVMNVGLKSDLLPKDAQKELQKNMDLLTKHGFSNEKMLHEIKNNLETLVKKYK